MPIVPEGRNCREELAELLEGFITRGDVGTQRRLAELLTERVGYPMSQPVLSDWLNPERTAPVAPRTLEYMELKLGQLAAILDGEANQDPRT